MIKLKVCGMKFPRNIEALMEINPDYIGMIFYPKSKRYVVDSLSPSFIRNLPKNIKKVGVFVDSSIENIEYEVNKYQLDAVQLHGNESVEFCEKIKKTHLVLIKAFHIFQGFEFKTTEDYKTVADYYLFDTQTKLYGGSGNKFEWKLLNQYNNEKPFFLSGGIGFEDLDTLKELKNYNIHAIDINSRFELSPGLKDIEKIKQFKEQFYK